MELYQIVWSAFALFVVWSVFFMPPLFLPKKAFIYALKCQELALFAGLVLILPMSFIYLNKTPVSLAEALAYSILTLVAVGVLSGLAFKKHKALIGDSSALGQFLQKRGVDPEVPSENLQHVVDNICQKIGIRHPVKAYAIADKGSYIDAFAMGGCFFSHGVIACTWSAESQNEVRATVAHEALHIKNNDILKHIVEHGFFSYMSIFVLFGFIMGEIGFLTAVASFISGLLIFQALSRKKEAEADLGACSHNYGRALIKGHHDRYGEGFHPREYSAAWKFSFLCFLERVYHTFAKHPTLRWRIKMCARYS